MNEKIKELIAILEREKSRVNNLMCTGDFSNDIMHLTIGKMNGLDFALQECKKLISK